MYNTVKISGNQFFYISDVFFGRGRSPYFEVADDGRSLTASVPENATFGKITVISNRRSVTGVSSLDFMPIPKPLYYEATNHANNYNGLIISPGGQLRLLGRNLTSVTGLLINNAPHTITNSGTVTSIPNLDYIETFIESGYNTRGPFRLLFKTENRVVSDFNFQPYIYISGIGGSKSTITTNYTGVTGSVLFVALRFKNNNIIAISPKVSLGGKVNGQEYKNTFSGQNPEAVYLSGLIPSSGTDGGIKLWAENGSFYENTGIKITIARAPEVFYVDNLISSGDKYYQKTYYLDDSMVIVGKNLQYVTGIKYLLFSGEASTLPKFGLTTGSLRYNYSFTDNPDPNSLDKYFYWSGWKASPSGDKITLPFSGTNYKISGRAGSTGIYTCGLSGLSNTLTTTPQTDIWRGLGLCALFSPYGVINQITPSGIQSGAGGFQYDGVSRPGEWYISDYADNVYYTTTRNIYTYIRYSGVPFSGLGQAIIKYQNYKTYDTTNPSITGPYFLPGIYFTGDGSGQYLFSSHKNLNSRQITGDIYGGYGFLVDSGVQSRANDFLIAAQSWGYGYRLELPGKSGWNWYATGTKTFVSDKTVSPWFASGNQMAKGWGVPRVIIVPKQLVYNGTTSEYYAYLAISGHSLAKGPNYFPYTIYMENGNTQFASGLVMGY
jgi:hypothetical protein